MIRVLVVDDSVVVRRLIVDALSDVPGVEVVGTAANGLLAQSRIDHLKPDAVTMDIEMPQMNGIEAVRELRKRHPRLPVIMFSTLSAAGASATLEALAAGATDYVTKPSNVGSIAESVAAVRDQLVPKIRMLANRGAPARPAPPVKAAQRPLPPTGPSRLTGPPGKPPAVRRGPQGRVDIIAIGSSTGGPDALTKVL
ncbi:MAG TPA: response regulator, partial [Actinoplanes sp.]|nr:response regulator [Actinoplanes sp.]